MSSLVGIEPSQPAVPESSSPAVEQQQGQRETNLLQLAWRSRWLILLCMAIGGGVSWVVLQRVTPLYMSVSRIFVERSLPTILSSDVQIGQAATYLYTQAELIRSTPVLAAVADASENANLECFREVDNRVVFLKDELSVMVGSQDDIINVMLELPIAREAAQLVNSVVDAYVSKYAEQRRTNTVEVLSILRNEKERRDAELESRREALDTFRRQNSALAVRVDQDNVITSRFSALAEELNHTEIELLEAKARYNRVKDMYEKPTQRPFLLEAASSEQRTMRDMELENRVQQVEQALTSERARWGEGHPSVRLLRESLAEFRKRLDEKQKDIVDAYVDRLRQESELLEHKRNELRNAYDKQFRLATEVSSQALQLASLEDALKRTEKLCDILDERIKEVNLSEEVGAMNVSIMEVAGPSPKPSYPVPSKFLAIGLILGSLVGFGLAWLRDLLDHRLRSVDEIAATLQLPVLGALPYFGERQAKADAGQLFALSPRSPAAEAVRTLRTAMHFGMSGHETKIIVVTSPSPGDGKSTVTSNLALAMSQADHRVLLIDADLRKPTQHQIFEISPERGLGSVLTERHPVEEAIVPTAYESLEFLPCGPCPNNPVELLNNGFFAELLEYLKQRYDKIIIDSPPVMPVADARVIAALGDATLLVLRAERSTRRLSLGARNELWKVRAARLGVVVNRVPMRKQGYGYGYGYGYGEGSYGSYGYGNEKEVTKSSRGGRAALSARPSPVTVVSGAEEA